MWTGALAVALTWVLVVASPTVHEPCPFLSSCSFLPTSWEIAPDQSAIPLTGTPFLPPPKSLPTPLERPPR